MSEIVIGVDPDSKKYGVAVWVDGMLQSLLSINTVQFSEFVAAQQPGTKFVVEDVAANNFIYRQNTQGMNMAAANKVAQSVGRCKQAQIVAEQFIQHYEFELIRQKPTKGNWAKDRNMFERITGWKGQSNEDKRSAAFLAFLYVKQTVVYHARRSSH